MLEFTQSIVLLMEGSCRLQTRFWGRRWRPPMPAHHLNGGVRWGGRRGNCRKWRTLRLQVLTSDLWSLKKIKDRDPRSNFWWTLTSIYGGTSGENCTSGPQEAEPAILGVPGASAESEYGSTSHYVSLFFNMSRRHYSSFYKAWDVSAPHVHPYIFCWGIHIHATRYIVLLAV